MAYAAVTSLKQTLQQILFHPDRYSIPRDKKYIESFLEKFEFLQQFLEEYPSHKSNEKVTSLERRIRDAAYEAEDFMDLRLKNLSDSKNLGSVPTKVIKDFMNLIYASPFVKLIKKVDSIIGEVIEIKEQMEIKRGRGSVMEEELKTGKFGEHKDFEPLNASHKVSSQLVSSDTKNSMVGFDDLLMQIKDQLTGLPLSIVVIGGLLSKVEKTQTAWQLIAENVTSFVFSSGDRCSDILRLSYNYLPHYLKACFLYMGVFPKNYETRVSKIIKLWIAEGFLRQLMVKAQKRWQRGVWKTFLIET